MLKNSSDKKLINKAFYIFFALFIFIFFIFLLKAFYCDITTLKNGERTICVIERVERVHIYKNTSYRVYVTYEKNGETFSDYFMEKKSFSDFVGDYFNYKYRPGKTIDVYTGSSIIPCAEVKKFIIKDICCVVVCIIALVIAIYSIIL